MTKGLTTSLAKETVDVRKALIKAASDRKIVYYSNFDKKNIANKRLSEILCAVSTFEYEHNRPLLSSIVVRKTDNASGVRYFFLCTDLKVNGEFFNR